MIKQNKLKGKADYSDSQPILEEVCNSVRFSDNSFQNPPMFENIHTSVDQLLKDLSNEQWVEKVGTFNNIASIIDHMSTVEIGFMKVR
ncbi:hypothetical protein NC797_11350 [Aquibacillus sp. 3ASR75-11]|uniref:DinB family protein n=1 Tax=Terrihalobacillus insolitus TaxID=2950438 RepID=A0A9X3WSP3_9BACI|nr:hypothetical protein [Terrihalobacillus insolitus]MDC3425102.1 hypothetical protein [Terrihalobacillus insolitus]